MSFWAEHASFNLCSTLLHFTDKADENEAQADVKVERRQTAGEAAEAGGNYTHRWSGKTENTAGPMKEAALTVSSTDCYLKIIWLFLFAYWVLAYLVNW